LNRLFYQMMGNQSINGMIKKELRKSALLIRSGFSAQQVADASDQIMNKLLKHPWYRQCSTLFIYVSMDNEVFTHKLIQKAIDDGKRVCVPRVIPGKHMEAVPILNMHSDLAKGFFNVLEPVAGLPSVSPVEVDLVVVPGLLFDREGYRIGYGGGYYDKYLTSIAQHCHTVGLIFQALLIEKLPREAHDEKVMLVITENEMIG